MTTSYIKTFMIGNIENLILDFTVPDSSDFATCFYLWLAYPSVSPAKHMFLTFLTFALIRVVVTFATFLFFRNVLSV